MIDFRVPGSGTYLKYRAGVWCTRKKRWLLLRLYIMVAFCTIIIVLLVFTLTQ